MTAIISPAFGKKTLEMTSPAHTNTRRRLALLFSVPLAFSIVFFSISLLGEHTDLSLLRNQNLLSSIVQLRASANDIESGERGFLLTGGEQYLLPFQHAEAALPSQVESCRRYAKDVDADLQKRVTLFINLVQQRVALARQVLQAQRQNGFSAALMQAQSDNSEENMNSIRKSMEELRLRLDANQTEYLNRQRELNHTAFLFFALGMIVMIVVMMWLYNATVSYLQARDEADARLHALNTDLEGRIEARTRDLQIANEELQQFAYVASHDLQEPLRTIISFTQLLASRYRGHLDSDADEFIGYIVTSARRMTDLINGLLTLARLRKAGQPTTPVRFEKLLQDAESALQAAIRESGAEITHGSLPDLIVDPVQFSQVFQNLLANAIKYRRDVPVRVHVAARRDGTNWVFLVSDNGLGFDQQFADRIFGLFQRLHSREIAGTGMGLSIARKIVERHGGRIWAESKPGVGSTFSFSLPVSLEATRDESSAAPLRVVAHGSGSN
ncbi:MAG: CHASE3 domain-containing protein [Acidobacteriaceae bacterium]|nr:CHASE3 domain-containing protein [Acidobacteriaceae bacterium]